MKASSSANQQPTPFQNPEEQKHNIAIWLKYLEQNEVTCTKEIEAKKKELGEYDKLKEQLGDLTKKLEKNVFIPVGKMAFLPGTLDRTNEFYTMIGDNHFVKKSSFRTVELLERRQTVIRKHLEKLEEELTLVKQRKEFADQLLKATSSSDEVEICEPYEEPEPREESDHKITRHEKPKKVSDAEYEALMKQLDELDALEEEEERALSDIDSDDWEDDEMTEEEQKLDKVVKNQSKANKTESKLIATIKKGVRFNDKLMVKSVESTPLIQEIPMDAEPAQSILKQTDHIPRVDRQAIEAMNRRDEKIILPESTAALKGPIMERDPMAMLPNNPTTSQSSTKKTSKFKSQRMK